MHQHSKIVYTCMYMYAADLSWTLSVKALTQIDLTGRTGTTSIEWSGIKIKTQTGSIPFMLIHVCTLQDIPKQANSCDYGVFVSQV